MHLGAPLAVMVILSLIPILIPPVEGSQCAFVLDVARIDIISTTGEVDIQERDELIEPPYEYLNRSYYFDEHYYYLVPLHDPKTVTIETPTTLRDVSDNYTESYRVYIEQLRQSLSLPEEGIIINAFISIDNSPFDFKVYEGETLIYEASITNKPRPSCPASLSSTIFPPFNDAFVLMVIISGIIGIVIILYFVLRR